MDKTLVYKTEYCGHAFGVEYYAHYCITKCEDGRIKKYIYETLTNRREELEMELEDYFNTKVSFM